MFAIQCTLVAALLSLAAGLDSCLDLRLWESTDHELEINLIHCGYNPKSRPVTNHKTAVHVALSLDLRSYTFDLLEETLTVVSTAAMTWHDDYLHWEPDDYKNIKEIYLSSYKIWTPSLELYNEVGEIASDWDITCNVTYQGEVSCSSELERTALCATDLRAWPYDTLTCSFVFGSWFNTGEEVNYTLSEKPINVENIENHPGWSLVDFNSTRLVNHFENSTYPLIKFELTFRREAAAEASATRGVGLAVALLPLAATLGGGTRLPLALFAVAAHMLALSELSQLVPRHGDTSPRLLLACRTSLLVAAGGVLAALLLEWLRARPISAPPLPRVLGTLVRIASKAPVNHFVFADLDSERQILAPDEEDPDTSRSQWLGLANLLDALFCIIALIIYAVLFFA